MTMPCFSPQVGLSSSSFFGRRACLQLKTQQAPLFARCPVQAAAIGPGKKWEHYDLTKNGKPVRLPMHVQRGDMVQVISGAQKGKTGKITTVITKTGQIVVDGINLKTKHNKPREKGETGQITQNEAPIHHSNVMLYSEDQKVRSKVGHREEDGKKVRYLKKTGEVLPPLLPQKKSPEEGTQPAAPAEQEPSRMGLPIRRRKKPEL
ncbi:Plastid ribosomal protein L24, variant 2 [Trebouxia sp. C0010 RCD-2024]